MRGSAKDALEVYRGAGGGGRILWRGLLYSHAGEAAVPLRCLPEETGQLGMLVGAPARGVMVAGWSCGHLVWDGGRQRLNRPQG